MDISYEILSSLIPMVQSIFPHDTVKFTKLGSSIRIDFKNIKIGSNQKNGSSAIEQNPFKKNFTFLFRDSSETND